MCESKRINQTYVYDAVAVAAAAAMKQKKNKSCNENVVFIPCTSPTDWSLLVIVNR